MTQLHAGDAPPIDKPEGKTDNAVRAHLRSILLRLASHLAEKRPRD